MTTIGLTGANGQVGFEVAAFLARRGLSHPIAIGRSDYSLAPLARLGITACSGDLLDPISAARLIDGCDLLADFAWPRGLQSITSPDIRTHIERCISSIGPTSHYVFISTQSVFRLDPREPSFKIYGLAKRRAEEHVLQLGRRQRKKVYILRLGEVHGPFQNCSQAILADFRVETAFVPRVKSGLVFGYDIADALLSIAANRVQPGTYTLLTQPEWSYREVHNYYARWAGVASPSVVEEERPRDLGWLLTRCELLASTGRSLAGSFTKREKELIEWILYDLKPGLARSLRLRHYQQVARQEISSREKAREWRPYYQAREVPGIRFVPLADVRSTILDHNRELSEWVTSRLDPHSKG